MPIISKTSQLKQHLRLKYSNQVTNYKWLATADSNKEWSSQ